MGGVDAAECWLRRPRVSALRGASGVGRAHRRPDGDPAHPESSRLALRGACRASCAAPATPRDVAGCRAEPSAGGRALGAVVRRRRRDRAVTASVTCGVRRARRRAQAEVCPPRVVSCVRLTGADSRAMIRTVRGRQSALCWGGVRVQGGPSHNGSSGNDG